MSDTSPPVTNTVLEPLEESPESETADAPVVVLEAVGVDEPVSAEQADGADEPLDVREALLARSAVLDQALATRDEQLAREVLHPGFALEIVQPVRSVMDHDLWLEVLADYVVHEWDVEEQVVDLDGDYAAVLQRVRMRATVMGEDRSGIFVVTDLWRCVDGRWVVWRRHSTPLIAGPLPGAAE